MFVKFKRIDGRQIAINASQVNEIIADEKEHMKCHIVFGPGDTTSVSSSFEHVLSELKNATKG